MRFTSDANAIYAPRLGRTIRFDGGAYETEDAAEASVLRHHPLVEVVECPECGSASPSACAKPDCPEREGDGEADYTDED